MDRENDNLPGVPMEETAQVESEKISDLSVSGKADLPDEALREFESNEIESMPNREAFQASDEESLSLLEQLRAEKDVDPKALRERWEEEKKEAAAIAKRRKEEGQAEKEPAKAALKEANAKVREAKAALRRAKTEEEAEKAKAALEEAEANWTKADSDMRAVRNKLQLSRIKFRQDLVDRKVLLSLRHLRMYFKLGSFPDYIKLKAVHDVSFDVYEGETFGIVGESGCGKSTTGRCILKLYDITSGSIYYKGYRISGGDRWNRKEIKYTRIRTREAIKKLKAEEAELLQGKSESEAAEIKAKYAEQIAYLKDKQNAIVTHQKEKIAGIRRDNRHPPMELLNEIQMIFQDPVDSLDPRMTVEDIIQEGLRIQGHRNKRENHQKTVDILKKVGLVPEHASRYPHEFSGGQRQRIGIARALIMNPKMLVCDEPISALDVSIRAQIINLLNELKEEMGLTMIFIAHDLSTVKYFCNRIAVMYYGNLVELASSDELFKHPLHPYSKSLLSAIPQPNPLSEKRRVRITYNPMLVHDYRTQKPTFREILPGHFVLCNDAEFEKYQQEIADLDSGKLVLKNGTEVVGDNIEPKDPPKAESIPETKHEK